MNYANERGSAIGNIRLNISTRSRNLLSRLQLFDVQLLRLYFKFVPSENQRLFFLMVIVDAICGLAAVVFHLAMKILEGLLINRALTSSYPLSVVLIRVRDLVRKFIIGALQLGIGSSPGQEGLPTISSGFMHFV